MALQTFSLANCKFLTVFALTLSLNTIPAVAQQEPGEQNENQPVTTLFELSFELDSLGDLSELTGLELPPSGPVSLKTDINVTSQGYTLSNIRFVAGKSDISGDITASYTGQRPALTARLHSERIDLTEFYPAEEEETEDKPANSEEKTQEIEKLFSNHPLPFNLIRDIDMDLTYTAKTILSHHIELDNFQLGARQENGNLDIHTIHADVANGKLVASGNINAANAPPLATMQLNINNLEPGQLPDIRKLDAVEGLPTDITFRATGTGNSIADILSSLTGSFLSKSGKGINYVQKVNLLDLNFLIEALNILNPFRATQNEAPINCIVVKFSINDGKAVSDRGIAAQTQNLNVIGGGIVDLKNEQFDLVVHPEARSGINIGAITLVDAVRVSGNFSDPAVNPETQANLLKRAGTVGAVLLTGGLSYIAQKLFEQARFKDDPCGEALQENASISEPDNKQPEEIPRHSD